MRLQQTQGKVGSAAVRIRRGLAKVGMQVMIISSKLTSRARSEVREQIWSLCSETGDAPSGTVLFELPRNHPIEKRAQIKNGELRMNVYLHQSCKCN